MEFRTTAKVPVERLRLDRLNPRLIGEAENASDEAIIARLYRAAEIDELLQSISANGYLDIEPMVCMPPHPKNPSLDDELIVLEGNRRLAALRLLRDRNLDLVNRIKSSERLSITIPSVDDALRVTFDHVSVYLVESREEARSFIGFKHINGPAKWDAYAKARFAAEWYKTGRSDGIGLEAIARAIGDRHDTIKRMVSAIYVLDQAADKELFDIDDRHTKRFNFSHLYTALARSQYMDYLGLESTWASYDPSPDPVSPDKLDELREILVWIYGSKKDDLPPVIQSQNPDIKRLGEVLARTESQHVLKVTRNLDEAHASTETVDKRFTASLIRARESVQDAANSLRAYDGQDPSLLDIAADVKETANIVWSTMSKKRREATSAE